jgi:hypothetical protein
MLRRTKASLLSINVGVLYQKNGDLRVFPQLMGLSLGRHW